MREKLLGIKRTILNKSRFMLFVAFTAFATAAYGQNQTVTVQKGKITVKALIAAIKKQTNLSVDYEGNTLNPNSYVNFSNTNQTVASVMDAMLKHNKSLSYSISGRTSWLPRKVRIKHRLVTTKSTDRCSTPRLASLSWAPASW